ncbi:MAG TPA: 8-amino-7-oxononanoate synthase [Kineosporiaceae bacterium]
MTPPSQTRPAGARAVAPPGGAEPGAGLLAWLDQQATQRAGAGLTRRLDPDAAGAGILDLAGNDYLGLRGHPDVTEGAVAATRRWGAGAGASRLVTGTLQIHQQLERELAQFCGHGSALVFSSGYLANLGVVTSLAGPGDLIVSDAHVHASLIDACRLSRAQIHRVAHNDVAAVGRALAGRSQERALVLTESIFSVLGDPAPLADLAQVCAEQDAVLVVDEAHSLGVAGPGGRGLVAAAGLAGRPDVVVTVTLSKALGSQGGAVLADPRVRDHLVNRARTFIFDTGLMPAAVGAALAALGVLADQPERVAALARVAAALAHAVDVPQPAGAVLAVALPGPQQAVEAASRCASEGLRVGCFRPPSVPDGVSRLRLTARATLTRPELDHAARTLATVLATAPPAA